MKRIAIDASNLWGGGSRTHLREILKARETYPPASQEIVVYGPKALLKDLPDSIEKRSHPWLDRGIFFRNLWQWLRADAQLKADAIDILWVPGGHYLGRFKPLVAMSRNMLIFDRKEHHRYPRWSRDFWRILVLRFLQSFTFRKADGMIYLSSYAKETIVPALQLQSPSKRIPHGITELFRMEPRASRKIEDSTAQKPFRILYVSTFDFYKHQAEVVEAFSRLPHHRYALQLDLVGALHPPAMPSFGKRLKEIQTRMPNLPLKIWGPQNPTELARFYREADLFVFASTCENMPNILVEAMAAGLPMVCSKYPPMPEFAESAAEYFDPLQPDSLLRALEKMIFNPERRFERAQEAYSFAQKYNWKKAAQETFEFLDLFSSEQNLSQSEKRGNKNART